MTWFNELGRIELIVIGVFIFLYILYLGKIHRIASMLKTSAKSVFIKFALRIIYFSLIILAILGPSFGEVSKEVESKGKDIYIALDLSLSMNATDIQPSRLDKVKFELKNIVSNFSSDRVGLIIFSSEAFVQCPLTFDQSALNLFIETLNTGLVPNAGTDFAPPLQMAYKKFIEEAEESVKDQAKVVILISDGEDFGEETQDALTELESRGIKVFTLGVGTDAGSTIPYRERSVKRDETGREVITTLKRDPLLEIAERTKGRYFEVSNEKNNVAQLIESVKKLEGQVRDRRKMDVKANKFYIFLLPALLLILLDIFITVKTLKV
ncbi:MAG: VWA domain-containing protein [Thermoflexibacter sp.]|jgi:Ca-activated chloride channel family protein|nr:VWA domain-containing protein [Thermoflexibacter sp.]